jgi:Protein of unknown function (DUF1194)
MMRLFRAMCLVALVTAVSAQTRTPVAVELVLALDSSASVDRDEFRLQLGGLSWALRDPDVVAAVEALKPHGVAIAVMQWGGPGDTRVVIPFTYLTSARDAKALAYLISLVQRWHRASETSIATAIEDGVHLLEDNEFDGVRKIIDVSGDGVHNSITDLPAARALAAAKGITVNGLPIEGDDNTLSGYYAQNVIVGAASFVEKACDFEDFARAMREKLLKELRPLES